MWRWEQRRPFLETRTGAEHKVVREACEGRASVAWLPFRAVGVEVGATNPCGRQSVTDNQLQGVDAAAACLRVYVLTASVGGCC